jgi:NTP pyrophosphatase (non-canonical NTP hydrolase)
MEIQLSNIERKVYADCIRLNGFNSQLNQLIEECLEAGLAARKYQKGNPEDKLEMRMLTDNLIDELADLLVMTTQFRENLGAEKIDQRVQYKILRQVDRVRVKEAQKLFRPPNTPLYEKPTPIRSRK